MKFIATLIAMLAVAQASEGVELMEGILEGAIEQIVDESSIMQCFDDVEFVFSDFGTAVRDIDEESVSGVLSGLKLIGEDVIHWLGILKDCPGFEEVEEDLLEELAEMAGDFADPITFVWKMGEILLNSVQIYDDVDAGVNSFEYGEYKQAGVSFGKALGLVITSKSYNSNSDLYL